MKFVYDLTGSKEVVQDIPVYGNGSAIAIGAALIRGATPGTNQGFGIVGTGALSGVLGILLEAHAAVTAGLDSKQDGTAYQLRKVLINPFGVFRAELAGTIAVASTSTTTVTVTSLEDDIDGGWLLGSDGQLQYLVASAAGSATSKTASGWTSANTLIKVLPMFHTLGVISTDGTKLQGAAAVGTAKIRVLGNYIKARGVPFQKLDPTKHSGITFSSPVAYSDIVFTDHAFGING